MAPLAAQAQAQAPLLDRELFFGDPEISGAQLSPDGQYISFLKPFKGTRNVWVKKAGEPFSAAQVITADTKRPITQYFWTRDSKYILYVQDKGGDENYNVYAVDPAAAPAAGQDVPAARNVTDAKGARALIYSVPKSEPGILYIGLNDRDKAWHDVYRLEIATGKRTLVRTEHREDRRLGLRPCRQAAPGGADDRQRRHRDPARRRQGLHAGLHLHGVRELRPGPVPQGRPARLPRHEQGRRRPVPPGPLRPGDGQGRARRVRSAEEGGLRSAIFSEVTDELVATSYLDDKLRIYFRDKALEADYRLLEKKLPGTDGEPRVAHRRRAAAGSSPRPATSSRARPTCSTARPRQLTLAVQDPREAAARGALADDAGALHVVRRPRDPGLPDPAQGRAGQEPARDRAAARRPVGARRLGLRRPRAVPGQPRLRRAAAQLPRLDRLRQEVPQRRQQAVGRQDAGRPHLGREVPGRPGHRRPQARRHHGRLLRRLRDAGRAGLHARPLRRRRLDRRAVEHHHAARLDPAVLGGRSARSSTSAWAIPPRRRDASSWSGSRRSTRPARSRRRCWCCRAPTTRG